MNTQTQTTYLPGQSIMILCHNSKLKVSSWHLGKFEHEVSALDRDYRINCSLANGNEIREAAPECIKPATVLDLIKAGENIDLATPYERKYNVQDAPGHYDGQIKKKGDAARVYCLYAINEKDNIGMVYSYNAWGAIYDEIRQLDRITPLLK